MPPSRAPAKKRDRAKGDAVDALKAGEMLGVSRATIYNYIEDGLLDYYSEPKGLSLKYMIYISSIKHFADTHYIH